MEVVAFRVPINLLASLYVLVGLFLCSDVLKCLGQYICNCVREFLYTGGL